MENVSIIEIYAVRRPLFRFDEVADFAEHGSQTSPSMGLGVDYRIKGRRIVDKQIGIIMFYENGTEFR